MMIPFWKIKREFARVYEHARSVSLMPVWAIQQKIYDYNKHRNLSVEKGAHQLGEMIVIYIIYQPKKIPDSIISSLDHFQKKGYSPFVVLNCSASADDLNKLKSVSSVVMRRENFGYDFGGYRDAVAYIQDNNVPFKSKIFINDSIWFPVFEECNDLDVLQESDKNLVGYSFSAAKSKHKREHVQSYFFAFSNMDDEKKTVFFQYWKNLRIASDRRFTIKNCEMKMTTYFKEKGFTLGWLFSMDNLLQHIGVASNERLSQIVTFYTKIGHKRAPTLINKLKGSEDDLRQFIIEETKSRMIGRNIIGAAPNIIYDDLGFSAMKKSTAYNYRAQKQLFIEKCNLSDVRPSVLGELKQQVDSFNK